jgi:nitrite reductase (NADH) small subunit
MSQWIEIGNLEDIPRLGSRVVDNGGKEIAIFRTKEDQVFALRNKCPHKGGPLSEGIVHGNKVACPLHNWNIDLASGEAVAPDEGCAGHYEVKVEAGKVLLNL